MNIRAVLSRMLSPRTRAKIVALEQRVENALAHTFLPRFLRRYILKRYLARPHEVDIEVTSNCDADCIMCPRRQMRRRVGPMEMRLFRKIVDEALALGVREFYLNGYGEIATLRNYGEYISYIRNGSGSVKLIINTNGMQMREEMARFLIKACVDVVNITIDGSTAATYQSIRRHLRLDVVEENVRRLIALRKQLRQRYPLVTVQTISMPQNQHEAESFLSKWKDVADHAGISGLVSRIGSVKFANFSHSDWQATPCFYLWKQMPILSDGTVALCCDDWDGRGAVGDLNHSSIKEIWTNAERQRLRRLHESGNASEIALCNGCQQPRPGPWWFRA